MENYGFRLSAMIGTELEMDGGEVAKLRIRKEKDFNITEFYLISFVFYGIRLAVSSEFIIFALYL